MDNSLKRRDSMQETSPKSDSDVENKTNVEDRLVSPCKRLRLHDSPVRPATFTDQTNIQAPLCTPEKTRDDIGSPQKTTIPTLASPEKSACQTAIVHNELDSQPVKHSKLDEYVYQTNTEADPCVPCLDTPVKTLEFDEEDLDSSVPGTPLNPIPNNTPTRSVILGDDDSHSDAEDIIINKITLEDDQSVNLTCGQSITFADHTNLAGLRRQENVARPVGDCLSKQSVALSDHVNVHGAQGFIQEPYPVTDKTYWGIAENKTIRPHFRSNPDPIPHSDPYDSHQHHDASNQATNPKRHRFSSAGHWLSSEELDHHKLSLQSYSTNFGDLQRPPQGTVLPEDRRGHLQYAQRCGLPQSQYNISSGFQRTFHPQNLQNRFDAAAVSSKADQNRLTNYGSIDGPHGGMSQVGYFDQGVFPASGTLPRLRDIAQPNIHSAYGDSGLYGNSDQNTQQGRLWFYGSIDHPKPMANSVYMGSQSCRGNRPHLSTNSHSQRSISDQGTEAVFMRSANRRTLPTLSSRGSKDSKKDYRPRSHEAPEPRLYTGIQNIKSHLSQLQEETEPLMHSAHTSQDGNRVGIGKASTGSLCILSSSGSHCGMASGSSQEGNAGHLDHPDLHLPVSNAGLSSSSGNQAEWQNQGSSGRDQDKRETDHHCHLSGSQGSVHSHCKSVGSQQSLGSQERSAGGSQQSSESQQRSGCRSRGSSGSQERSAGGSHHSADGRGNVPAGPQPEAAFPTNPAVIEASKRHRVLETSGLIKVAVYLNCGLVTVHVMEGRNLSCSWKDVCDSYIKLSLIPEEGRKLRLKSKPVLNSNNPVYDEKFSLELQKGDENKRLLVSIWHKDFQSGLSEFLGCSSFGIKGILLKKKSSGLYYLLTEEVGKKKHLQEAAVKPKPQPKLKQRSHSIPQINQDVSGLETKVIKMERGKSGFGFKILEEFPVKVNSVDLGSPAGEAGLKDGDYIIKVNDQNVSRSTKQSVVRLLKKSGPTLILQVNRPPPLSQPKAVTEQLPAPAPQSSLALWNKPDHIYESIAGDVTSRTTEVRVDTDKESEYSVFTQFEQSTVYQAFSRARLAASTPHSKYGQQQQGAASGKGTVSSIDQRKVEAIHCLMSLELDFIDFMQLGIERYLRPLRHCIFNVVQHNTVFQNIEQLVNVSEFHVRQMQENAPSMYPESDDDSQSSEERHFASAVAMIYYSKVQMFCQAHESYAAGLSEANRTISEMRENKEFIHFAKNPPLAPGQPSISAFILRPLQHIKELASVLQEIFQNTPNTSIDYATLKEVMRVLQESLRNISDMSNARVQSLTSLSSHTRSSSAGRGSAATSSAASSKVDSGSEGGRGGKRNSSKVSSSSPQSVRPVDQEVMNLQDRLLFSENVPVFELCEIDRHFIYQGEVYLMCSNYRLKMLMILLSDMIIMCQPDKDGFLRVLCNAIYLHEICDIETSKKDSGELVLSLCPPSPCTGIPRMQSLAIQTPSPEDLSTWKNLLEQRLGAVQGTAPLNQTTSTDLTQVTPLTENAYSSHLNQLSQLTENAYAQVSQLTESASSNYRC